MRVSKRCQYALRAVFELALRDSNQPVKIHEIARSLSENGTINHLEMKFSDRLIARSILRLSLYRIATHP